MKIKPPLDRRKFANEWDEIEYLYDKILYWLYQREDAGKARPYADRLERLLPRADPKQEAILGQECWSLVFETKGDLPKAIEHRQNEIRLIRRLHEICRNKPSAHPALEDYGYNALSDRLELLATLYHAAGQLDRAIETVQESKRLCKEHGIRFDGADLLREYLEEKRTAADGQAGRRRATRRLVRQPARKSG
jgi:tetratricopeptide (TPR) repeat protein